MAIWHQHHGKYWMVQWCFDGWLSLGIHIDFKRRVTGRTRERYAPYMDLHIGCFIFSIGYHPNLSTSYPFSVGRGGDV